MDHRIYLTPDAFAQARAYSATVLANRNLQTAANYTGLEHPGRYETGYLGEWAFHRWLYDHQITPHGWNRRTDGKSDDYDFIVAGVTLDVKCSGYKDSTSLWIVAAQFPSIKSKVLVCCTRGMDGGGGRLFSSTVA